MDVEEVIAKTKKRYSLLETYEDEGVFSQRSYGRINKQTFRTSFSRPGNLLFQTQCVKPDEPLYAPLEKFGGRLVMKDGKAVSRFSHAVGEIDHSDVAIFNAVSSSRHIFRLVVPLLLPDVAVSPLLNQKFKLIPDRSGANDSYHLWCLEKRFHIWIDKDDMIIRRFKQEYADSGLKDLWNEKFPQFHTQSQGDLSAVFDEVRWDQPIAESVFSFDDYVSEPVAVESAVALFKKMFSIK